MAPPMPREFAAEVAPPKFQSAGKIDDTARNWVCAHHSSERTGRRRSRLNGATGGHV